MKRTRRDNGLGCIRQRDNGTYELGLFIGYHEDGRKKMKYFYGKTKSDVNRQLQEYVCKKESGIADSYGLFGIAEDELAKGNNDMAVECLTAALKLEKVPNKQIIMKTLVVAYENKRDFASALELMTKYVAEYPDDEEAKRELTFLETRIPAEETESN